MSILCMAAFTACSFPVERSNPPPEVAGVFAYGAFDLQLRLYLNQDGTYRETSVGPLIVLLPDGTLPSEPVREKGPTRRGQSARMLLFHPKWRCAGLPFSLRPQD